ncbi:hypothetical protein GCM10007276_34180 [Agaricicola taiwanensis]|uniref:Phytochrome chromophore attachment site domain-containing protein n=1 Tax=Agaricicola taiwanensis TaxID=591372 RepID=A0A8J2YN07_9RHOB|nr:hypothetical protein GCM10007276_34180 [Agaricicola taiwanensis]
MLGGNIFGDPNIITSCDQEPIHIPGSIQPHGIMLVADAETLQVVGGAGDIEGELVKDWLGRPLPELLLQEITPRPQKPGEVHVLKRVHGRINDLNAICFRSGEHLVVELDQAEDDVVLSSPFFASLEVAGGLFERTTNLEDLCQTGAEVFRDLTGYGRVMIYQFLDDDAGVVIAESRDASSSSFLRHHFPASDIPRQARALYVRNKVRVIPDVHYQPAPLRSGGVDLSKLDLSDSILRSVSPIHIQYLKNMEVAASASISIIKDGLLWGLIACHHHEPRELPLSVRLACQTLASVLSQQIRSKEDAERYKERIRLRTQEDAVVSRLGSDRTLNEFFERSGPELAKLLNADGFAAVQGKDTFLFGKCPDKIDVRALAGWAKKPAAMHPLATSSLARHYPAAEPFQNLASGLLAVTMSTEVPTILLWFRAEHLEVIKWAGNPHKDGPADPEAILTPRASFEAWTENVRGRARAWSHAEIEAAARIVRLMLEHRNNQRLRELNRELTTTLKENESLLLQKDYLLKEVNHRVQNSLQLVSGFLHLQARSSNDEAVKIQLQEAQKRLTAVALVHRRLYQDDSVEIIDLSRYLEDLLSEMRTTMDADWWEQLDLDLAPILISTDRAVNVGLIATELVINAHKYAYDGRSGPMAIRLEQHRDQLRLIVADRGKGKSGKKTGFGSRMMHALVERLHGTFEESDNQPGLRIILTAPINPDTLPERL